MDKQLLDILVCPASGMPITLASADQLEALNSRVDDGSARFVDGSALTENLQAMLVTRDQRTGYPIKDGIPVMLPECGIELPGSA